MASPGSRRPTRRAGMFVAPWHDPRQNGALADDERGTLVAYLRYQRQTLELKCSGLGPDELARRSVEPSTMSLLGLVRHMADVERAWFRLRMAALDAPPLYRTAADPDGDFDGAEPDPKIVEEAWRVWREEMAFADEYIAQAPSLDAMGAGPFSRITLREVLIHMIEEYARHNGHADLLRERIDGRVGM